MAPGTGSSDYGQCAFKIDARIRRAEPPDTVKGDIARAMLYRSATYGFNLSHQDQQLLTAWSRQNPPDAWEQTRHQPTAALQGRDNPLISQYASRFGKTAAAPPTATTPTLTCGGKKTCSEMASCEKAMFYLQKYGVKSLDRDGDGIPCASLCR